jgi:colicin import membrane protein
VKRPPGPPPAQDKPRQPGSIRAVFLAIVVHAAFFALIVFGVTWQSRQEAPLQAELWKDLPPAPKAKAPEPEPPKPEPTPEPPKPEPPKPEPEPPRPEPPKKVKPEPPKPDPAIALKEKKEREKKERLEKLEREKKKKDEEAAKKKKEDDARKKKEDEAKRKEEDRLKREQERARAEAAQARNKEKDKFIDAIRAKIRGRANVPDNVTGNPEVQVLIRILPGGEVLDLTITKRSGNPTYDAAIERGIRSASPLPVPPANSELFPQFRELSLNIRHER